MRKVLFVFLALVLVACASAALAQQPPQGPPPPGQFGGGFGMRGPSMSCPAMMIAPPQVAMIERSADTLALTDDQKTKLTDVLTKSETALRDLRPKADAASKALRDALFAPTFDSAKVAGLLADAQKIETAIANSEIGTWTEIRAILTADQVTKLSDSMNRRMGGGFGGGNRGGGNRGNRGGGNPGGPPPAPPAEPAPGQ